MPDSVGTYSFQQSELIDAFEAYHAEEAQYGYLPDDAIKRRDADVHRLLNHIETERGQHARKLFRYALS